MSCITWDEANQCVVQMRYAPGTEHEAFDAADRAAMTTALGALAAIRAIPQSQFNERVMAEILSELRHIVEGVVNWKHQEHATDVGERLSDCVYVLENAADAIVREQA